MHQQGLTVSGSHQVMLIQPHCPSSTESDCQAAMILLNREKQKLATTHKHTRACAQLNQKSRSTHCSRQFFIQCHMLGGGGGGGGEEGGRLRREELSEVVCLYNFVLSCPEVNRI